MGMSGRSALSMRVSVRSIEDGSQTKGEVAVDAEQTEGRRITRTWLDPEVRIHSPVADAIQTFDAVIIGPGSFFTSLMPILLVKGLAEALRAVDGPIVLVANILTEGRGMKGFTAGDAVRHVSNAIGRPVDVVLVNSGHPSDEALDRYVAERKELLPVGDVPDGCEVIAGTFWQGSIARHARRRLSHAVWSVLAHRLLS